MKTNKSYIFSLIFTALTVFSGNVLADPTVIYSENFGSTSSNTALASYSGYSATTAMFSTSGDVKTHYSGSGSVGKNNLSAANLSNGYTGASGLSGCYHGGTANTAATIIQISNIKISGYSNLHLSFGALGGSTTHKVNVTYKIDNGSETALINNGSITNANWTLKEADIPGTGSSLTIYIKHTPTKAWTIRLDDIKVTGTASTPTPSLTCATTSLSFSAAKDGSSEKKFTFSGANLKANAGLAISGTNSGMFSVSPNNVSKGSGTITDQEVTVTYSPTAAGNHSATLTISSTDATSKTITLTGSATSVTANPQSITFDTNSLDGEDEVVGSSTITSIAVTNGTKSSGNYLNVWVESDQEDDCLFSINNDFVYTSGNSTSISNLSVEYLTTATGTFTGNVIAQGYLSDYTAVNCTIPLSVTITAGCDKAVTLSKGTPTNASIDVSTTSLKTCDETATNRRVTVSIASASCYVAPLKESVSQTGTATAEWVSGPTWNGSTNKYDYVYEFAQNATGTTTFNVSISDKTTYAVSYNAGSTTYTSGNAITGAHANDTKTCGTSMTLPGATFTTTGYTQTGWATTDGGTLAHDLSIDDYDVDAAANLYPVWTAQQYAITYYDGDATNAETPFSGTHESNHPTQHTYGEATTLKGATKTGYTFGGWYANKECTGEEVTNLGATAYTTGMTLYAKWTVNTYDVAFDANDGSGTTMTNQDFTWGVKQNLSANTYTAPLHKFFYGWNTNKTQASAGTREFYPGEEVQNLTDENGATVTLYAVWANHTFTNYRTLCCNEWDAPALSGYETSISVGGTTTIGIGSGTTYGDVSYTSNDESVLTVDGSGEITGVAAGVTTVTVTWAGDATHCETSVTTSTITVVGEVTVTFNKNGGSGTMDDQEITVGTPTNLSANEFTAPSTCEYFYGWAISQENADNEIRAYEDEEEVTITEGKDLYAIWKTYNYTVTKGTGTGAATFSLSADNIDCGDGTITVTATPDGTHKGSPIVSISPANKGEVSGTTISNISGNITVNVEFAAKATYTITWMVGNETLTGSALTGVTTSVTEDNGLEHLPANPSGTTLSGADTFMGWSKNELSGLGNNAPSDLFTAAGDEPEIDGNVTYHAVFATQTAEESDSWDLVNATANVTEGDYVITCKISDTYYYLKSETEADNTNTSSVGTGLTFNSNKDKLTNTVAANMQWSFTATNDSKWNIRHKKDNTTTYYLGAIDDSKGIRVNTTGTGATFDWVISNYDPSGLLLNASGISRYLTVYSTTDWRYYASANGPIYLFKHNQTEAAYANYITKVVALSSIAVTTAPSKTVYKKGETLDLEGMVVTATYADESTRAVTGYTVDLDGALSTDDTKFVVTYEENGVSKTAEQAIKVYELSGIAITTDPTTTTYKSGATLSTAGMEVTATWGGEALDAISEAVTGYTVDLSTNLATTDTEFEVTYTHEGVSKTATKEIHVYDLSGITITTASTKTSYTAGDVFAPAGMVVSATWGGEALDKIVQTVDGYTYSEEPLVNDGDVAANVDVTISYTSNGVTKTATQEVTVAPKAKKVMTWHVANEDPFTTRIYIDAQDKYILAFPDEPEPVAAGFTSDYVFKGWTTATSVNKDGSEITYASAGAEMSDDEDFYAVFAQKNGEDIPGGYRIVEEAPADDETVIIARKVNSTYYAMTNSATPGYDALTITNGVISGTTTSYQWSVASATNGVYLKQSSNYLHLNSGALKVASSTDNGDIIFTANNGTYTANLSGNNSRWIIASGDYGFGCGASENAAALYIFKYADATVATYSNYRLVPSTVAVPTGLEAGTYYCTSKSITLSQAAGKPIYYTLDGSTPDKNATLYSSAIVLNTSKTIKAVAYDSDLKDYSGVASAEYTIITAIDAPTMTATQTFYDESMEAEISHALTSEGAVIHYSYDDASYSNYSDALTIDETKTVYAYATIGELTSPKASATYTKGVTYTYKKVTSDAGLAVGMKFIIVSGTNGAGAIDGDHLVNVTVPSPNEQSEIAITNQAVKEFTLGGRSGAYQLVSDQGELGSNNAKSLSYTLGTKTWTISYSGEQVTIENTTTTYGSLQYNSNGTRFNTYTSAQSAIDIYALSFTAHTLTVKDYDGENKTVEKVVEGGAFVLTNDDAPSNTPGATYEFLHKWTDGTNTYAVGDAVTVNADVTLQPCWKVTPTATQEDPATINTGTLPAGVIDVVVTEFVTLNVNEASSLDNLTVEAGGKVSGSEALTVNNFTIEASQVDGKSGQVTGAGALNVTGEAYFELKVAAEHGVTAGWYTFAVPFEVDALNGVYYGDTKLTNEVNYAIMAYDGDVRAQGKYGWKKYRGTLKPGTMYTITLGNTDYNVIRFRKASGSVVASNEVTLHEYPLDGGADGNNGWNAVANPNLYYSSCSMSVAEKVQYYDHESNTFSPDNAADITYIVGSCFFVQANNKGTMTMVYDNDPGTLKAPQREAVATEEFKVRLGKTTEDYVDQLFVSASEDATDTYQTGHDLRKCTIDNKGAKVAQMTVNGYGMSLCDAEFPLVNNKAIFPLTLTSPKAEAYTLYIARQPENATLYLMQNGSIIWNLTTSPFVIDLPQGSETSYSLMIVNAAQTPTDVETVSGERLEVSGVQKIILNEHVYILRDGKMYDAAGAVVR